jgi:hypothetical protein
MSIRTDLTIFCLLLLAYLLSRWLYGRWQRQD